MLQKENNLIEISSKALINNLSVYKKIIGKNTSLIPIIKSNAYGHGLKEVLNILKQEKIQNIGVNSLEEALKVHQHLPLMKVMIMGSVEPHNYERTNAKPFIVICSNKEEIKAYSTLNNPPEIHIKFDTGMGRLGFPSDTNAVNKLIDFIKEKNIPVSGLATHFANVEDVTELSYPYLQLERFLKIKKLFEAAGFSGLQTHSAASAAALLLKDARLNAVRLGISLYGVWPSAETKLSSNKIFPELPKLQPVLSWKSRIAHIQNLPANSFVGYGCTYKTSRASRIAVLPFGYYEGYPRILSNKAYVIIKGKRAPVVGRICMNMTMADISDIPEAALNEEVIVIGKDDKSGEEISADQLASLSGTINYEIFTNIKARLKRKII